MGRFFVSLALFHSLHSCVIHDSFCSFCFFFAEPKEFAIFDTLCRRLSRISAPFSYSHEFVGGVVVVNSYFSYNLQQRLFNAGTRRQLLYAENESIK